eukprot:COSAG02_NODE_127_length_34879_cov_12.705060_30_plen_69_part_00
MHVEVGTVHWQKNAIQARWRDRSPRDARPGRFSRTRSGGAAFLATPGNFRRYSACSSHLENPAILVPS